MHELAAFVEGLDAALHLHPAHLDVGLDVFDPVIEFLGIDDILGATQTRLADLRSFVSSSRKRSGSSGQPARGLHKSKVPDSSATNRLESQVQELVEMVGAGAHARK